MVDAEGNSSYDGGAFDITIIDVNGATDESSVRVNTIETRQNFADVKYDFGEQGSNGWIFQWSYEDDPYHAYNMYPYDAGEDRYFHDSYLEIKRDYVNPGTHDRSAVIKWRVCQHRRLLYQDEERGRESRMAGRHKSHPVPQRYSPQAADLRA